MRTILLIEDNKDMRENTAEILELAGYKVITAKNGKIGVDMAQKQKVDLIICDVMMPELDGYGVLHLLGKNPDTATIPFIFLTAKAERSDFRKGMELGADDYIPKPFDDTELLNAIEVRFKRSEILKKEFSGNLDGLNSFINEVKALEEMGKLSRERNIRKFKKKEYIYSEGSYPHGLFFLNKGKVKTFKTNPDAKEFITGLYKDSEFFGYLALIEESPYKESAMAMEDSKICIVSRDDFFELIYKNRYVSSKFIKMLSNNLLEKEEQLIQMAYNSVRKRVADGLLLLQKKYQKEKGKKFTMTISRESLASIVGTSPETLIRTLSDFKEEKLIDVNVGDITILDADRLIKMKN